MLCIGCPYTEYAPQRINSKNGPKNVPVFAVRMKYGLYPVVYMRVAFLTLPASIHWAKTKPAALFGIMTVPPYKKTNLVPSVPSNMKQTPSIPGPSIADKYRRRLQGLTFHSHWCHLLPPGAPRPTCPFSWLCSSRSWKSSSDRFVGCKSCVLHVGEVLPPSITYISLLASLCRPPSAR